jgi:hypothetical protein
MLDSEVQSLYAAAQSDMLAGRWEAATAKLEELAAREPAALRQSPDDQIGLMQTAEPGLIAGRPDRHRRRWGMWALLVLTVVGCGLIIHAAGVADSGSASADQPPAAHQRSTAEPPVLSSSPSQALVLTPQPRGGDCGNAIVTVQQYKMTTAQRPLSEVLAGRLFDTQQPQGTIQVLGWNVTEQSGACIVTLVYWENERPVVLAWSVASDGAVQPINEVTRKTSGMAPSGIEPTD